MFNSQYLNRFYVVKISEKTAFLSLFNKSYNCYICNVLIFSFLFFLFSCCDN